MLQIPSDAEIVMATMKVKRREQTALPNPPSTYASDIASITSLTGVPPCCLLVAAMAAAVLSCCCACPHCVGVV